MLGRLAALPSSLAKPAVESNPTAPILHSAFSPVPHQENPCRGKEGAGAPAAPGPNPDSCVFGLPRVVWAFLDGRRSSKNTDSEGPRIKKPSSDPQRNPTCLPQPRELENQALPKASVRKSQILELRQEPAVEQLLPDQSSPSHKHIFARIAQFSIV